MEQPAAQQPVAQPAQQPVQQQQAAPAVTSKHSAERRPGHEHIPVHPKGFIAIRILQLVFCLICIGLAGYVISILAFSSTAFMIFVCVVTLIMSIYNIVALTKAPAIYNYWAVLAFEIFLFIFWLIAFAWVAATAAFLFAYGSDYYEYYSFYYDSAYAASASKAWKTLAAIAAAAAGIGALTWILYFVSLVMTSILISRHRSAGLHNRPHGSGAAGATTAAAVPAGAEKVEMQPQQPGQIYPQPSGYSQQAPPYGAPPQQGYYGQPSMSPPPQQMMAAPPQQYQQQYPQQEQYAQQPQQYPQQYPQHSGQAYPQHQQYAAAPTVSQPSGDGSHSQHTVPAQTTGGSYVQGNPVAFPNAAGHENGQHPQQGAPIHEAHGQSYNPNAPRELQ